MPVRGLMHGCGGAVLSGFRSGGNADAGLNVQSCELQAHAFKIIRQDNLTGTKRARQGLSGQVAVKTIRQGRVAGCNGHR